MKLENKISHWRYYSGLGLITVLVYLILSYSYFSYEHMTDLYVPMIETIDHSVQKITVANLWYEDILYGNDHREIDDVWKNMEQAKILLHTFNVPDNGLYAGIHKLLNDEMLVQSQQELQARLAEYINTSREQYRLFSNSSSWMDMEHGRQALFSEFINKAHVVDSIVKDGKSRDIRAHAILQGTLSFITVSLFVLILLFLNENQKRQILYTQGLEKEIDVRKATEQDLIRSKSELSLRNRIHNVFLVHKSENMFRELLHIIIETLESEVGTIGYYDEDANFVVPVIINNMYWEKCQVVDKETIFQKGNYCRFWTDVINIKKTLIRNEGPFNTPDGHVLISNTIATPIISNGEVISIIHLANKSGGYNEQDQAKLEMIADLIAPVLYVRLQKEQSERRRHTIDEATRTLTEGVTGLIGDDFFNSLVRYLSILLDVDYVLIGELLPGKPERIRTIAMFCNDKIQEEEYIYDLAGTPCENVVGKNFCFYESGIQKIFPSDTALATMNAESYVGNPVFDANGQPMGILAAISTRPIKNIEMARTIFGIFTIRCGAEMERRKSEMELRNLYEHSRKTDEILRRNEAKLRALAAEITIAEEQERRRIAVDMHDHFIQDLCLCKIKLGMIMSDLGGRKCCTLAEETRELTEKLIGEARTLVFELSVPVLYEFGLEAAIKWLGDESINKHGFSCSIYNDGQAKPLSKEMQVILFKAVRELMTNIVKHARAEKIDIYIDREDDRIVICVQDDGVGFIHEAADYYNGDLKKFGLFGIKERLNLINGLVMIKSAPGRGTSVTLTAPLDI